MQSASRAEPQSRLLCYALVAVLLFAASFFKIADLDFWWHLKTGQIIWQQKAFQYQEIYSFTEAGRPYIDHEWLFQVIAYLSYALGGATGVILLKCGVLLLIYLFTTRHLLNQGASPSLALAIVLLSVCGARVRFIERPEIFSALFLVLTYVILDDALRSGRRVLLLFIPLITVIWVNTHAAVVLGLLLQFTFLAGLLAERVFRKLGWNTEYGITTKDAAAVFAVFVLSLIVTGINPYGYRVLKVPFELTAIIDSGLLKNQEWQRPTPETVPFFFLCLGFTLLSTLFFIRRASVINVVFGLFLSYISLRYVRNVGLFCIFMPLLVAPFAERFSRHKKLIWPALALAALCFAGVMQYSPYEWGTGEASYFPDGIVKFTTSKNLRGNMINSYGFGGYFIWKLYPERKIFIDGRNEVYLPLLKKLISMRGDNRSWNKLLDDYQIEYALLNYVDDLETVTRIDKNGQATTVKASFCSTHFPKSRWALVYWDDEGMIFVRRTGINQELLPLEYTSVYPEGRFYQEMLARSGQVDVTQSIVELHRKLAEDPGCRRAAYLLQVMQGSSR